MFPMTVTISSIDQLQAVQAALGYTTVSANKPPVAEPTTDKKEKAAGKKVADKPAAKVEEQAEQQEQTDGRQYSYQEAAAAVTSLAAVKGRSAAVEVLGQFGASKLPDLAPEKFGDLIAACQKAQEE